MRTLLVCLLCSSCALWGCSWRVPSLHTPPPHTPSTAVKFPGNEQTMAPQGTSAVERIYAIAPTENAPALGAADAKVKLEVCSDFQCPYCAEVAPILKQLNENYGELLRIVWRNCPLPFHSDALPAAEAALEVQAQRGDPAFWAYHDVLFTHQSDLSTESLVSHARAIEGVDGERVRAALRDHRHVPHIQAEVTGLVESGAASDGLGTPVSFINGRMLTGALPYEKFEDAVEAALQEQPDARKKAEADSKSAYPMARLRHILVEYKGARGAEPHVTRSKDQARARATELRARLIKERIPFAKLASDESDCPSKKDGGELGRFTLGDLEPQLEQALFGLEPGEVSEVVESPFGYHILLRED
ncbi:MAG: Periplasmic thiol disulfide interchange protein DsbA [Myxococcaceae bacterium]|nr:Periplasmic thiol disulfide interchange protein DsbA [Myxococcaceae bacterium]